MLRRSAPLFLLLLACSLPHPEVPPGPFGDEAVGAQRLASGQRVPPAGKVVRFAGRAVDLAVLGSRGLAVVKEISALLLVELETMQVLQRLEFGDSGGSSMHGIAVHGDSVWVSDAGHLVRHARLNALGRLEWVRAIDLTIPPAETPRGEGAANERLEEGLAEARSIGGEPYPCGLALDAGEQNLWICLNRYNQLAQVDLGSGRIEALIPVGIAPFDVVLAADGKRAWVSNFGGRRPLAGETTASSGGSEVLVDGRGIATSGTVVEIDLAAGRVVRAREAGLHPSDLELSADGQRLFVAATNSDQVRVLDTDALEELEQIDVRIDPRLPFGSLPNALALAPDGQRLYVANGGNNAVAVVRLGNRDEPAWIEGFLPTDWFPGALAFAGEALLIASVKGDGSLAQSEREARHVTWTRGSLAKLTPPAGAELARLTTQAHEDTLVPAALRSAARARSGVAPRPVPLRSGEPSVFEHVVYVLKENRTYDQVFGDLPQGNGDPALCIFGREVTPNHHALAEEFVLLDNYYCNGVVSADGHQWATQGIAVDYLEKQFGGWTRSYDLGTDALTYASSGFLWDGVLLAGLSFRNYGEFDFPRILAPEGGWYELWKDRASGAKRFEFTQNIQIEGLRRHSAPRYPGWEMRISDQVRVDRFLEEFKVAEQTGVWPNLVLVYLPQDHTSGTSQNAPTPRAHVADNDLALGRLVEAISNSRFWNSTCIFVNEDDPQDGFDHVDGHRSLCLVISPYTQRGLVSSRFYNQNSVLHTMERMLGVPAMTQADAGAPTMEACFSATPDYRPYTARPARIALDEPNPKPSASLDPLGAELAALSDGADLAGPDRIDDDAWNRILWHASKPGVPYPAEWAGAHGRGLSALSLTFSKEGVEAREDD